MANETFQAYRKAAAYLKAELIQHNKECPQIGIICGSGLSGLSDTLTSTLTVKYSSIPGFPPSTGVVGHKGEVVFGLLDGNPAMCFRGRFHSYEGHDMNVTALPARVMRCLGVKLMIVTNAAGGLNSTYNVGDIVSVMDYFAIPMLAGKNPLIGHNDDELGPRFPPTSNAFDEHLQSVVLDAASKLEMEGFVRKNGTYCFVSGPMYESKAECRFLKQSGGDCVGMSTVPEIVAAHHSGMKVLCLSLVTNKVVISGDEGPPASHQEVLDAVNIRSRQIQKMVKEIAAMLHDGGFFEKMTDLPEINLDTTEKKSMLENVRSYYLLLGLGSIAICAILKKR